MRTFWTNTIVAGLTCIAHFAAAQEPAPHDVPTGIFENPSRLPASKDTPSSSEAVAGVTSAAVAEVDEVPGNSTPSLTGADMLWSGTASIGLLATNGTRDLDDSGSRWGAAGRVRTELKGNSWRAMLEATVGSDRLRYDDDAALRQAYVEYTRGRFQINIGRQIVAWGRADRLNPTDNLSPRDLPALVSRIDEDRIGIDALAVKFQLSEQWSLGFTHVPKLRASVLPRAIAEVPELFGGHVVSNEKADAATNALRLDFAGNRLDGSISFLRGAATSPALLDIGVLDARQPQLAVIGADFSVALNDRWGLRGEFADTRFKHTQPVGLADFRYAVLGIERHFDGGWLGLVQWVHRDADHAQAPTPQSALVSALNRAIWFQTDTDSDALYIGLNRAPFEGDLSGDLGVLQTFDDRGRAWFANLEYRVADRWTLLGRWQHFNGQRLSNLGGLRKDSLLLLELRGTWGWRR